jgi:CAAX prenyl protease-like protein
MDSASDTSSELPSETSPTDTSTVSEAEPGAPSEPKYYSENAIHESDFVGYGRRRKWLLRNEQWLIYCLPFVVFMVVGAFEPRPPKNGIFPAANVHVFSIDYQFYPYIYSAKIALTCLAMAFVWPGYRKFPFRVSPLAFAVGIVGAVLWVAICKAQQNISPEFLTKLGLGMLTHLGERPGFNPLKELADTPAWAWTFLAIRFFGLVVVVSILEEFFLRGFMMRYFIHIDWWEVPFATATPLALVIGTAVPMLMHPQELAAAFVWFSLVTWLMLKTKNIWDCVIAHGTTNLLMGLWVLYSGDWWFM